MEKVVVVYSGGLDSTVLLYQQTYRDSEVYPFMVDYGQRHRRELECGRHLLEELNLDSRLMVADLSGLKPLLKGSSQTDSSVAVPQGHYQEDAMKATVVPNRNMLLIASAVAYAISVKAQWVLYGAHSGDHAIYPDCRPEFVDAMQEAISLCDYDPPILGAPFRSMSKAEIVELGASLEVPFEKTWSCYEKGTEHCGLCATCVERREAFFLADVLDMTSYQNGLRTSFNVGKVDYQEDAFVAYYEKMIDARRKGIHV